MNRIICGDAYGEIRKLASESIDCIVTSPPYWGLRDYGVGGQLGLEHSLEEYLAKLCAVFDECKRVLKKTGTCWINLGDTYWNCSFIRGRSADGWMEKGDGERYDRYFAVNGGGVAGGRRRSGAHPTLKEKSLCLIPSRFAIAMVARGWILRNEIIWHKPNCMPASVKDRFTVDFEKLFFVTKSRTYYFSQQREPLAESSIQRLSQDISHQVGSSRANGGAKTNGNMKAAGDIVLGRNKRCVWVIRLCP